LIFRSSKRICMIGCKFNKGCCFSSSYFFNCR
jgi:hypothetical protein